MKLVVLISGGGTTLTNLADRIDDGRLAASIVGVISSKETVGAERARQRQLPTHVVPAGPDYSNRVFEKIRSVQPDLVVMAGWLKLLTIPADFQFRVVNIHPSLLPAFGGAGMYGQRVHQAVLDYGVKISGCTVHFADDSYDTGPIILQQAVPVHDDDTAESLAARVFAAECEAYPKAIELLGRKTYRIQGRKVIIESGSVKGTKPAP